MDRENTAGMPSVAVIAYIFLQVQYPTSGVVYRSVDGAPPHLLQSTMSSGVIFIPKTSLCVQA